MARNEKLNEATRILDRGKTEASEMFRYPRINHAENASLKIIFTTFAITRPTAPNDMPATETNPKITQNNIMNLLCLAITSSGATLCRNASEMPFSAMSGTYRQNTDNVNGAAV